MAVKRELSIRRQPSETKEVAPDPDPAAGKSENIDTLVSSFLAELTDLSSEMKNQAGSAETVEAQAGKPGTKPGTGNVRIPKSVQLHEDISPDADLEIINDQIEQSLVELESLKSGELKTQEASAARDLLPELQLEEAKSVPVPQMKEQEQQPIAPPTPDPEEQAWDSMEIFRDRFSFPVRRQRKNLIVIIGVGALLTILALLVYSLLTSAESTPAKSADTPERNTVVVKPPEPAAAKSAPLTVDRPSTPVSLTTPASSRNKPMAKQPAPVSNAAERKAPPASATETPRPTQIANNGVRPENQERSGMQPLQAAAPPPPAQPTSTNPPAVPAPEPRAAAVTPPVETPPTAPSTTAPANGSLREAVSTAPKTEPPSNGAAPEPAPQPRRRTPVMAEIITRVQPEYPAIARQQRVTGRVEVEAEVNEKGDVVQAKAVSGPILLRAAAEQAVTKWKFKPASIEGVNIPSKARIAVHFNLQ